VYYITITQVIALNKALDKIFDHLEMAGS